MKLTMFLGAYVVGEFERKFILFDAFLHKLHIYEKFDFGDRDQDALG